MEATLSTMEHPDTEIWGASSDHKGQGCNLHMEKYTFLSEHHDQQEIQNEHYIVSLYYSSVFLSFKPTTLKQLRKKSWMLTT